MIIAESARWGDFKSDPAKTPQDWRLAVDFVREQFFPSRTPIVIEQLRQTKRWEFGRPGDPLVEAPLYGDILTSKATDVQVTETVLEQNYPNPFNPVTVISFSLHSGSKVRLTIHDLLGRKVGLLVNERLPAGAHQVTFDAENMASGTYIYTLSTDDRVVTKRMMLIK